MSAPDQQRGIVVAVDGSPASNAAAIWAAREAAMRKIPLTVVHAVTTPTATWPPVPYPESLAVRLEDEGKKAIMHAIKLAEEALPADRKVTINRELVYSSPALTLINDVRRGGDDRCWARPGVDCWPGACSVRSARPSCGTRIARSRSSMRETCRTRTTLPSWWESTARRLPSVAIEVAFDEASRRGVGLTALHAWSDIAISDLPEAGLVVPGGGSAPQPGREPGRLAGTLSRCGGAAIGRAGPAGPSARRKVRIRTASRRGQSRARRSDRRAVGIGQQRGAALGSDTGDRRPAASVRVICAGRKDGVRPRTKGGEVASGARHGPVGPNQRGGGAASV